MNAPAGFSERRLKRYAAQEARLRAVMLEILHDGGFARLRSTVLRIEHEVAKGNRDLMGGWVA